MKRLRQFITGTLALAVLGTGSLAMAETAGEVRERTGKPHAGEHHQHRHQAMRKLADKLELTEEQRQTWRSEQENLRADNRVERHELREAHKALRQARKEGVSELEVAVLRDNLAQLRAEDQALRQQQHERFMAILTPEQREQLVELKAQRKAQHREGKQLHRKGYNKEHRG